MEDLVMTEMPLLALENISKSFGGLQALQEIELTIFTGEVHAVLGENGAGKSTLMKIIAGALHPDTGKLVLDGKEVIFEGPRDASQVGIAIVYQEPSYFPELSVLENFYIGEEIISRFGTMDWDQMAEGATLALTKMGLSVDLLGKRMSELSIGTQQLVLIARGIHKKARVLILDEPTSILSQAETDILFSTIRELKKQGISILYISHRLSEIFQIADRITVLRDGKLVNQFSLSETTEEKLIQAMSGRQIATTLYQQRNFSDTKPILEVKNLTHYGLYQDVSFKLHRGEILGLYGLVGAGRSEVATTIFGELPADHGKIFLNEKEIKPASSKDAIKKSIIYMPEDRRIQGLFPIRSIQDNLSAGLLGSITGFLGTIRKDREVSMTSIQLQNLKIKTNNPGNPVTSLSGGNQQKVVLGRGLSHKPRILILDEPTRGIDVGTKNEIYKLIMELAGQGMAILLISSDLPEVLALADNFMIMHEGYVMANLSREEATEEAILRLALGLVKKQVA
jgi:ABC-type sugar transport system ATPase subunit